MLRPNVIIMWTGTNASIPTGFTRVTDLDDRFIKGTAAGTNPGTTGGSSTHSHTSNAHSHTMIGHTHTGNVQGAGPYETSGGGTVCCDDNHDHSYTLDSIYSGGTLSDAVTYASVSSDPAYTKVIYIKSTTYQTIPTNGVVLWNTSTAPSGYTFCNGTGGTTDLRNKYLKGATAGGDGGGTGGTNNHQHTINHTHTAVTHVSYGTSSYRYDSAKKKDTWSGGGSCCDAHSHTVYSSNSNISESGSAYSGSAGSADTVEPAYKKLNAIAKTSPGATPTGYIALWSGLLTAIPAGWFLCDGTNSTPDMRNYFLKIANDPTEIGNTGGSNSHSHAASNSHTHTASGQHYHPTGGSTSYQPQTGTTTADSAGCSQGHSHTPNASSNATSSWNSTTVSGNNNTDTQPAFTTVAFIQYKYGVGGGVLSIIANT